MKLKQTLSIVLIAFSLSAEAAETCMHVREVKADQIRFVDTQLRIAALQCADVGNRDMRALYNDFVRAKRPYFIETAGPLRKFLTRTKRGSLDHYVVSTANRISLNSNDAAQFCERARLAIVMSAKMPNPVGLVSLLPISYNQPERTCNSVATAESAYD